MNNDNFILIENSVIDIARDLDEIKLPTILEILQYYEYIKVQKRLISKYDPSATAISTEIALKLISIWNKTDIHIISKRRIEELILEKHYELKKLNKRQNKSPDSEKVLEDVNKFKTKISFLFDMASCKCKNNCSCPSLNQMNQELKNFLHDQRTSRVLTISTLQNEIRGFSPCHKRTSDSLPNSNEASPAKQPYLESNKKNIDHNESVIANDSGMFDNNNADDSNNDSDYNEDSNYCVSAENNDESYCRTSFVKKKAQIKLPNYAKADRFNVSQVGAAYLASCLLYDVKQQTNFGLPDNSL